MKPYYEDPMVTIYHGDCLEIASTLDGVTSIVSDPPYGMGWPTDTTKMKRSTPRGRTHRKVVGDDKPFDPSTWLGFEHVVLFGANHYGQRLPVGTTLVWIKKLDGGFGTFLSDADIAWMKGGHGVFCHRDTSLCGSGHPGHHPTQKPVTLMRWCIQRSKATAIILDPYMGSGSTLRAAKDMGIRSVGIEIDEEYCEIAAKRMAQECLPL